MNIFAISDIHGIYKEFKQLLEFWNPEESKLVLLGDLIDRGPHSLEVIQKVMALKAAYGEQVVFCKGNHEQMLLDFIHLPEANRAFYFPNGGQKTMQSLLNAASAHVRELNIIEQAHCVKEYFAAELAFLEKGQLYELIGDVLLIHAGFESHFKELAESTEDDFLWIRDHYL